MDSVLVINAGSSSVKFQAFARDGAKGPRRLLKGQIDGIGSKPKLKATASDGAPVEQMFQPENVATVPAALELAQDWLNSEMRVRPSAVGHRVVHGGPDFDRPVRVTPEILARLEGYVSLAPLHQPNNLLPIRSFLARMPDLPQIACFDTAFHRGHDALADYFAIPRAFHEKGIRRYGFHGLSYEYIVHRLEDVLPDLAKAKLVIAHLGSGVSMSAVSNGRSVENTMGFTALDGLPMGTRPGQIDPGVVLHLIQHEGMTAKAVEEMFYKESGLKGLSGISNDVRDLLASSEPTARFALDYFCYRIALHAGMLASAMGGIDAMIFTAGIGENAPWIRAEVAKRLAWLGAVLDPAANDSNQLCISKPQARTGLYVIPTDEELMIARHSFALLDQKA